MLFSSIPFLYYFLPCVLILYFGAPQSWKNAVLLISSLIFYAWGEPAYVFLMAGSILIGYIAGIAMEYGKSRFWLVIGLGSCLGVLLYFKYGNFFVENMRAVTGVQITIRNLALPVGISFYTFQLMSYLIDVYRGEVKAQRNLFYLATYITMFPQLIAGPIVRYQDVEQALTQRTHTLEQTVYGIRRFVIGLAKKTLIANVLAEFCTVFHKTDEKSVVFYWAYALAVTLQIYFDFSGYSDMAIGLGRIFGFRFGENFRYPFVSKSLTEFWRRWHISLGNWFRDYVYVPLGGNRGSKAKWIRNLLIVWCLTGLWHGAQWNFVFWGLSFGILLILEKLALFDWLSKRKIVRHFYTCFIVVLSFVLFDAETLSGAAATYGAMFGAGKLPLLTGVTSYYLKSYGRIFLIAGIGATPLPSLLAAKIRPNVRAWLEPIGMILLLLTATAYLVDGSFNPFLYFRF